MPPVPASSCAGSKLKTSSAKPLLPSCPRSAWTPFPSSPSGSRQDPTLHYMGRMGRRQKGPDNAASRSYTSHTTTPRPDLCPVAGSPATLHVCHCFRGGDWYLQTLGGQSDVKEKRRVQYSRRQTTLSSSRKEAPAEIGACCIRWERSKATWPEPTLLRCLLCCARPDGRQPPTPPPPPLPAYLGFPMDKAASQMLGE